MPYSFLDVTTAAAAPVTTLGAPLTSVGETLATMQAWLTKELASRTDVSAGDLTEWINRAYKHVTNMVKPKELEGNILLSLVSGQPLYALPAQVAFTYDSSVLDTTLYPNGGRALEKIDLAKYRRLPVVTNASPRAVFRFSRYMVFWPTPGASYSVAVDCKANVVNLTNATDSPLLQEQFHFSIMLRAKREALRAKKLYKESSLAQNDFVEEIRGLIDTDAEENVDAEFTFMPTRGYNDLYNDEA